MAYLCSAKKSTIQVKIIAKAFLLVGFSTGSFEHNFLSADEYLEARRKEEIKALQDYHGYKYEPIHELSKSQPNF